MINLRSINLNSHKTRAFILPVALILLFIALFAGSIASKLAMQQTKTTGSALDSFISHNYAKEVLNQCESYILSDTTNRSTLSNSATASSALWQTWAPGVVSNSIDGGGSFDAELFRPTPVASIATSASIAAAFQDIMPTTANGACFIEPLTGDRFILTARAMTLSSFDMVQLQSFIEFTDAAP